MVLMVVIYLLSFYLSYRYLILAYKSILNFGLLELFLIFTPVLNTCAMAIFWIIMYKEE